METELLQWIAIGAPDRTGITRETACREAARPARFVAQMAATEADIEALIGKRVCRTGRDAGLLEAAIARVRLHALARVAQCHFEPERAAIAVPELSLGSASLTTYMGRKSGSSR